MDTKEKHIVITGATSGIGLELLSQLYQSNEISIISRPSTRLDNLKQVYKNITVYEADLSDLRAVKTAASRLVDNSEQIDILINNAAVQYTPTFLDDDFNYETIEREIDTNFTSVCALTYLLLPKLQKTTPSIILNMNSGLGMVAKKSSAIYSGTKGALNIFSQSLSHQMEDTNISVKQVFLPLVETAMTEGRPEAKIPAHKAAQKIIKGIQSPSKNIYIGKAKLLWWILRFSPSLAQKIMKAS